MGVDLYGRYRSNSELEILRSTFTLQLTVYIIDIHNEKGSLYIHTLIYLISYSFPSVELKLLKSTCTADRLVRQIDLYAAIYGNFLKNYSIEIFILRNLNDPEMTSDRGKLISFLKAAHKITCAQLKTFMEILFIYFFCLSL